MKRLAVALLLAFSLQTTALAVQECSENRQATTPTSRFVVDASTGTVLDKETQLTWDICSVGQTYRNGECVGYPDVLSWHAAVGRFTGDVDGRLPTIDELGSLIEWNCLYPAINTEIFPHTGIDGYWSATKVEDGTNYVRSVYFSSGEVLNSLQQTLLRVRLIRAGTYVDSVGIDERRRQHVAAIEVEKRKAAEAQERREAQQRELEEKAAALQRQQDEIAAAKRFKKEGPGLVRKMTAGDFCRNFGLALRREPIDDVPAGVNPVALFKADAKRRGLAINSGLVANERIRIGMSECELYASWGFPDRQSRSVGRYGTHIQHVYSSQVYVYTENGRVTGWQD